MDNDIRVVTDKEVYLLASPGISKSETEVVFRNWLRTGGLTEAEVADAIAIVSIEDIYLPMSVTSVESWGNWRLLHGSFQKREFERDQRQYERDHLAYQAELKKHQAAKDRGEHYALPPMPRSPDRDEYYEYFPDSGEYTTSFKGILRAFGDEALGRAKGFVNDVAASLDQLLRHGFPAAEAASTPPAPINREALNRLVGEYVSDRGIDWVKEQAKKYETAKKLEISDVHYRRECNIVFLPVRLIEYAFAGGSYTAISDPIRNEYLLGTPPAPVKVVAPPVAAGKNTKLISIAAAVVVVLIVGGVALLKLTGKSEPSSTAQAPAASPAVAVNTTTNTPPAAQVPANINNNASAQAAAQAAAAQQAAAQKAIAAAQAAQEAAAAQVAQEAAAAQAAQEAAAAQAAQEAAAAQAKHDAAVAQAAQEAAARKVAAQAAEAKAAQEAAAARAEQEAAAARAEQQEEEAARVAQEAAAAKAAQAAQASQTAAQASPDNSADGLTAAANASPAAPPATSAPAASKAMPTEKTATKAAPEATAPVRPVPAPTGLTGKAYEEFASGQLRLPATTAAAATNASVAENMSAAAEKHDAQTLSKTTTQTGSGNDLGYYYLGVAAQDSGNIAAARTYYQLSLQHSETNNPPSVCSPGHKATYQPQLCHGIILPGRAARALASLPAG